MQGAATRYAIEPAGSCVLGLVLRGGFRATRGRERFDVQPGDLVAWDAWQAHRGAGSWEARLLMIELPEMAAFAADPGGVFTELGLRDPVVRDRGLAARFAALHRTLAHATWALDRDVMLTEWLHDLTGSAEPLPERGRAARDDPALRRACAFLADNLDRNVTLDELAAAAGVSRFRVARLFRAAVGAPPHRFQLAQRLRLARRLLERGAEPSAAAARTGFFDQSHMHRHFVRAVGATPGRYAAAFASRQTPAHGHH
jgi:AraC-like DNA-binding protein